MELYLIGVDFHSSKKPVVTICDCSKVCLGAGDGRGQKGYGIIQTMGFRVAPGLVIP